MRHRPVVLAALLSALLSWAGAASAAVLPVSGTLTFELSGPGGALSVTGSGIGSSTGGVGGDASIPAGLFGGTTDLSIAISPPASGMNKITVPAPFGNLTGAFTPGGFMGNTLVAHFFFTNGGSAGAVPLNYIGGGVTVAMGIISGLPLTVQGVGWTNLGLSAGNPTVVTVLMGSSAGIPITVTGTARDNRTAGGEGTLQLVAPTTIKYYGGALGTAPVIGTLTLVFTPEPGTLLLVGAGAVGLFALARGRRRS